METVCFPPRSSSPTQVLLPIANWKPKNPPVVGDDIGPLIVHVYEVEMPENTVMLPFIRFCFITQSISALNAQKHLF